MPAIALSCSGCGEPYRVIASQAGMKVRCPRCNAINLVPITAFAEAEAESPTPPPPPPPPAQPESPASTSTPKDGDGRLAALAAAVATAKQRGLPGGFSGGRLAYTHSSLAKTTSIVARILLLIAIAVEAYVLITTEWSGLVDLPLRLALPAFALTFLPAGVVAVTGLFLMAAAHATEYLARISAAVNP